jgi:hypothetical protein
MQAKYGPIAVILLSVIFMRVWRHSLRLWGCTLGMYHQWHIYSITYIIAAIVHVVIDGKIHHLMCVDTYSLKCIHFPL